MKAKGHSLGQLYLGDIPTIKVLSVHNNELG